MFRIDTLGAAANNTFQDRDTANNIIGTVLDAGWLNRVQEEFAYVIETEGITLDKEDYTQLYDAISSIIAANSLTTNVHADLTGKQGGTSGEYYHLTQSQFNSFPSIFGNTAGANTNFFASNSHTHPTSDFISGTFGDGRISETSVTQHEGAITITSSQVADLNHYDTTEFSSDFATTSANSLSDVNTIGVAASHTLFYNATSGVWESILGVSREYVDNKVTLNSLTIGN